MFKKLKSSLKELFLKKIPEKENNEDLNYLEQKHARSELEWLREDLEERITKLRRGYTSSFFDELQELLKTLGVDNEGYGESWYEDWCDYKLEVLDKEQLLEVRTKVKEITERFDESYRLWLLKMGAEEEKERANPTPGNGPLAPGEWKNMDTNGIPIQDILSPVDPQMFRCVTPGEWEEAPQENSSNISALGQNIIPASDSSPIFILSKENLKSLLPGRTFFVDLNANYELAETVQEKILECFYSFSENMISVEDLCSYLRHRGFMDGKPLGKVKNMVRVYLSQMTKKGFLKKVSEKKGYWSVNSINK